MTAAIAGCIYQYCKETYQDRWVKNELLRDEILDPSSDAKPYLLIGGDISGVQKFIYTITSKGALRSLKGRSFYLELFVEHVISELIEKLGLTRCNLLFSGGGHFYILSYNTPKAISTISDISDSVNSFLYDEFKGSLFLNIAWVLFGKEGFKNSVPVWNELSEKIENIKKRKWQQRLYDVLKVESQHKDCNTMSCEVCYRED